MSDAVRAQLSYLLARSAFYREKLAGHALPDGLDGIASLPLTDKAELRATVSPEHPMGTHVCVGRDEIARIYSTSGTTGTPSYIPLTAGDVERWVAGSARSYAMSGVRPGPRCRCSRCAGPAARPTSRSCGRSPPPSARRPRP